MRVAAVLAGLLHPWTTHPPATLNPASQTPTPASDGQDRVAEDPGAYIIPDPGMVTMLKQYRESGRKTFLVTNSLWEYTDVVMNFLVGNTRGPRNQDWVDLFDVVIVGSRKPAFLEDRSAYMMRVKPDDGSLWNVDGVEKPVDKFLGEGKVR